MRILYLASVRIPSEKASGLAIMRQCEAFASLGHAVTLIRPSRKNSIADDAFSYYGIPAIFSVVSVPVFPLFISLGLFGYALMRITLLCTLTFRVWRVRNEVDILYARDPWLLLFPLLFFPKQKMIVEMHSKHSNWVTRFVVASAGGCVVISEGLRAYYTALTKRTDILLEPSGVDLEQFNNMPEVSLVRQELILPQEAFMCGYVGKYTTMGEEKGVSELIEAFGDFYKTAHNAHLLLVGIEQHEHMRIHNTCSALGIPANAYTLRELDTKLFARYLHACDVLLMNYPDTEHYRLYMSPSKLFAYMAAGKIIVTSNLPSIHEIVDEHMVIYTQSNTVESIATALKYSASNAPQFDSMRNSVKKEVIQYSWEQRSLRIMSTVTKSC